jgi:hypothetical protein
MNLDAIFNWNRITSAVNGSDRIILTLTQIRHESTLSP